MEKKERNLTQISNQKKIKIIYTTCMFRLKMKLDPNCLQTRVYESILVDTTTSISP